MNKQEKLEALRVLAVMHPRGGVDHIYGHGRWKNPLNIRSTGRRWTRSDLEIFRQFQSVVRETIDAAPE
jgi:hypothetical protein